METGEKIIRYFSVLKAKKIIAPAYIFIGNNPPFINRLFKLINCRQEKQFCSRCWSCRSIDSWQHPDLLVLKPEGLSLKIEAIRRAIPFLFLKSYCSPKKILFIEEADKLTPESSNLFLKTLEEPPPNSFIALSVPKLEDVLPTVISRCRRIYLPSLAEQSPPIDYDKIDDFVNKRYFNLKKRKSFVEFLDSLSCLLYSQLRSSVGKKRGSEREELFSHLNFAGKIDAIEKLFTISQACDTVNINLALSSIETMLFNNREK